MKMTCAGAWLGIDNKEKAREPQRLWFNGRALCIMCGLDASDEFGSCRRQRLGILVKNDRARAHYPLFLNFALVGPWGFVDYKTKEAHFLTHDAGDGLGCGWVICLYKRCDSKIFD